MLAGAVAPSEASWVALTVLYTACQRYGVPVHVISDSGGAFLSDAFVGGCTPLAIYHQTIVRTAGGNSYKPLGEYFFNSPWLFYQPICLSPLPPTFYIG